MLVLLTLLGFLVIIFHEIPPLIVKQRWRELWAVGILLTVGLLLSLAILEEWPVPNPTPVLQYIFKPVSAALGIE